MRIVPYRTTENLIEGLVLSFEAITRPKQLQRQESLVLSALANCPVSVHTQDLDGRFTWACSSVFGRPGSELLDKNPSGLVVGFACTAMESTIPMATGVVQ